MDIPTNRISFGVLEIVARKQFFRLFVGLCYLREFQSAAIGTKMK